MCSNMMSLAPPVAIREPIDCHHVLSVSPKDIPNIMIMSALLMSLSHTMSLFERVASLLCGLISMSQMAESFLNASLRYLSTLAVLQLDAILPNAVLREKKAIKRGTKNQKGFSSILIMEYYCPAIGLVRLTVGQKRNDGAKVQYCITAIEVP